MRLRSTLLVAVGVAAAGAGRWSSAHNARALPLHDRAAALFAGHRPFEARLSGSRRWVACRASEGGQATGRCDNASLDGSEVVVAAAILADARGPATASPALAHRADEARWAVAVVDLAGGAADSHVLTGIIERLSDVTRADTANADARNDLAVAYLALATSAHDTMALVLALDQVERAAALDSLSPVIAFNRALLLEQMHLYGVAEREWKRATELQPNGGWRAEGERHLARLRARRTTTSGAFVNSQSMRLAVERDPQHAREYVLDSLLPAWARAAQHNDRRGADSLASGIRAIAQRLAAYRGDSAVTHVARECQAGGQSLAAAVTRFTNGVAAYRAGDNEAAEPLLSDASNAFRLARAPALAGWSDILLSAIDINRGRNESAIRRNRLTDDAAMRRGDLSLAARAKWGTALASGRMGEIARSSTNYASAGALFDRIGEGANTGAMLTQASEALTEVGQQASALRSMIRGLAALDEWRKESLRFGALLAFADQLRGLDSDAAARAVLRDALLSSLSFGRPSEHLEALARLARSEVDAGRAGEARLLVDSVKHEAALLQDTPTRDRLMMEWASADADLLAKRSPRLAAARLAVADDYFRLHGIAVGRAETLARRASLLLALSDTTGAERDLVAGIRIVEARTIDTADTDAMHDRAAALGSLFRVLVSIRVARHDTLGALLAAEHGRGNPLSSVPPVAPGSVWISYTVLPSQTIMWIGTPNRIRMAGACHDRRSGAGCSRGYGNRHSTALGSTRRRPRPPAPCIPH